MTKASPSTRDRLKEAIEKAGSAWIFRYWGSDVEKNVDHIAVDLDRFAREYQRRFKERPDPLELMDVNPLKGAAFFQIDTLMVSVEMKIMVWRILLGCEVARVEFKYEAGKPPKFSVTLCPPYGEKEEYYEGKQASDFRVLRHFGVTGVGNQLFLQGYYAGRGM
jgi:hypothetical protein